MANHEMLDPNESVCGKNIMLSNYMLTSLIQSLWTSFKSYIQSLTTKKIIFQPYSKHKMSLFVA